MQRQVRRVAVTILGVALLVVGVAMMVLPGPGILGIVAGLAVLASEYTWARRLLTRARVEAEKVQAAAVASPLRTAGSILMGLVMIAVGVLMFVVDDVAWPVLDRWIDKAWSPVTGGIIAVGGLIVIGTTVYTLVAGRRAAKAPAPATTPTTPASPTSR